MFPRLFEYLYDARPRIQGPHPETNPPHNNYSPLGMSKKGSLFTSANVTLGDQLNTVRDMIRDSTQWRPLLPKEGGLIQTDIGGHPPIPLAQNNCPLWQFPSYFSTVFRVLNFQGRFEALNDVFLEIWGQMVAINIHFDHQKL